MERIFYSKKTSIMFVVAMLMLLTALTQMASMKHRAEYLAELIESAKKDEQAKQDLIEYMKTDDYVIKWAEQNNKIKKDDILWIQENIPSAN